MRKVLTTPLLLLLVLLLVMTTTPTAAQQQRRKNKQKKKKSKAPLQPIGDVLMLVLDKDQNRKVTMSEVNEQLTMLEAFLKEDKTGEYAQLFQSVKTAAPKLFELLDVNGDRQLVQSELAWVTTLENSLTVPTKADGANNNKPSLKDFVRDAFGILDADHNDHIAAAEWEDVHEHLPALAAAFHQRFPLRSTPDALRDLVADLLLGQASQKASLKLFRYVDADGDGQLSRTEVGKAYKAGGKKWMEISQRVKEMGPMMSLLMGAGGGGGAGGGFKMEF